MIPDSAGQSQNDDDDNDGDDYDDDGDGELNCVGGLWSHFTSASLPWNSRKR